MIPSRRLIEANLPIKKINEHARREKSIRHRHISTLHIWWARRPMASSKTSIYAALTPELKNEEEKPKQALFNASS